MKRTGSVLTIFIAALCLMQTSCKKIDQILTFSISDKSSFTIPASTSVGLPVDVPTPDVSSNSSQAFSSNNTDANHVKNIYLEELNLTVTNPSSQTFDFVKSVHLYISTKTAPEIELAGIDEIPTGVQTIQLTPTKTALDAYIKSDSYTLRTQVVTRQLIDKDVTVEADSKFKVTAKL